MYYLSAKHFCTFILPEFFALLAQSFAGAGLRLHFALHFFALCNNQQSFSFSLGRK